METKIRCVDVEFAGLWLSDLQHRLRGQAGEAPQRLALEQFFTLNQARVHWVEKNSRAGKFEHVVAVLAIDRDVPVTRTGGIGATFVGLALDGMPVSAASVWSRLLNAVWKNEIDLHEVQQLGIYAALDAVREGRRAIAPTPTHRGRGLVRGEPLVWTKSAKHGTRPAKP